MRSRAVWSVLVACACTPGAARAQLPPDGPGPVFGSRVLLPYTAPSLLYGGYPYGGFAGPPGPAGVGAFGFYVPRGFWPNGLSLYGPPVPVPGAVPGVFGNYDLNRNWQAVPLNGVGPYGVLGAYATWPRPRVSFGPALPVVEGLHPPPGPPPRVAKIGGALVISIKVPQPAAEVFVDGRKTTQGGTDRLFESPPLEAGRTSRYTVTVRWLERGQVVEASREVSGVPGEVVRLDFTVAR
jgi:uncharacterized protein (TIGR03000 family)